jgi:anti-sigma-K factor RskA
MSHREHQELLPAYALDALEASDAQLLKVHLRTCSACQTELAELRDASALLAQAVPQATPSNDVRERILAAARAEPQRAAATSAQVIPLVTRAQRSAWGNMLRLAAAIAFVALLVGIVVLWRRNVTSQREIAQLSRQLNQQRGELARERDAVTRQREALALLSSPGANMITLSGTKVATNARATFVFNQQTGHAMLMTDGLPEAPTGMAYEVWFIPPGHAPMPGRTFTVDARGHSMMSDQMPMEARAKATIAITLEPKSGSAQPTGAIYLSSPAS